MRYILVPILVLMMTACSHTDEEKAAPLLARIDSLYAAGKYRETLDSIVSLRSRYPKAVEARRAALRVWQDASLRMAQDDIARTDNLLQETTRQLGAEHDLGRANWLRVRRDSLEARYQAMCGVVRMIHARQKQD